VIWLIATIVLFILNLFSIVPMAWYVIVFPLFIWAGLLITMFAFAGIALYARNMVARGLDRAHRENRSTWP
jgi:ABC-type nickel/cobalt efflux system permease component RcnA